MDLVRHASMNILNVDGQMNLLLSQVSWAGMLGNTLDYLAQIGPPAITVEVFPETRLIGPGMWKRKLEAVEAVLFLWKRKRENSTASAST